MPSFLFLPLSLGADGYLSSSMDVPVDLSRVLFVCTGKFIHHLLLSAYELYCQM